MAPGGSCVQLPVSGGPLKPPSLSLGHGPTQHEKQQGAEHSGEIILLSIACLCIRASDLLMMLLN